MRWGVDMLIFIDYPPRHWPLLLGKLEAYSVLHTTYSWMRGYLFNSKNFITLQEARTDQCVPPGE